MLTMKIVDACRICKQKMLVPFLSLGEQPHCNRFLRKEDLNKHEPTWPLGLLYCESCSLVQLGCIVDPEFMFRHYLYVSGTTQTLRAHFRQTAEALVHEFRPPPHSLVVDIGSNDGTFLEQFKDLGMQVVGVDPASNVARLAANRGIETVNDFFSEDIACNIVSRKGRASLITAAGVFFHIDDMDDVCRGIDILLDDSGILQVQVIYLGSMLENISYDNIYHEHLSYYTLRPLIHLFSQFKLEVFHVEHAPIHGGSILVHVGKQGMHRVRDSVAHWLIREQVLGWDTLQPYREFASCVERSRDELRALLQELKRQGKRIAAYGAPAKGNTLLNYCRIGADILDYAAETAPLKIGLYTPGTHIPVIDEIEALMTPPDYFLLLPWNFKEELIDKNRHYRDHGGSFIVPIPKPHIL